MRNDGEIRWNLNDLDVATVEELEPEGAVEVQNLRSLGMGWAWYVNDLSKYLPGAETLAGMAPADDDVVGVDHDVPLSEIALEPERMDVPDEVDPYTASFTFSSCRTWSCRTRIACRETVEMDSGTLTAREFFNPDQTSSVRFTDSCASSMHTYDC